MNRAKQHAAPRRARVVGMALAALAIAMAADFWQASRAGAEGVSQVTVDIQKFAFAPREVTVAPGTRVVWTNHDETPHTVLTTDKSIVSPALDGGDTFGYTFAKAGDFDYFCGVHPFMTGVVHVRGK